MLVVVLVVKWSK